MRCSMRLAGRMDQTWDAVVERGSRRVHLAGLTRHPDQRFMLQASRDLRAADVILRPDSLFICDRDRKWSSAVLALIRSAGMHVVQTPVRAPNCNPHAERFVQSIKHECLNRLVPFGERHLRRSIA
jgi:putative transposase